MRVAQPALDKDTIQRRQSASNQIVNVLVELDAEDRVAVLEYVQAILGAAPRVSARPAPPLSGGLAR